jgi:hypothetical protein
MQPAETISLRREDSPDLRVRLCRVVGRAMTLALEPEYPILA